MAADSLFQEYGLRKSLSGKCLSMLAEFDGREMRNIHVSLRISGNLSDKRGDERTAWEH